MKRRAFLKCLGAAVCGLVAAPLALLKAKGLVPIQPDELMAGFRAYAKQGTTTVPCVNTGTISPMSSPRFGQVIIGNTRIPCSEAYAEEMKDLDRQYGSAYVQERIKADVARMFRERKSGRVDIAKQLLGD